MYDRNEITVRLVTDRRLTTEESDKLCTHVMRGLSELGDYGAGNLLPIGPTIIDQRHVRSDE